MYIVNGRQTALGPALWALLTMGRMTISSAWDRKLVREFTEIQATESGDGNARKAQFQTREQTNGISSVSEDGVRDGGLTEPGDVIQRMRIRVSIGQTRSGGQHIDNAAKVNTLPSQQGCGMERDGHVRRELMIPGSIGLTEKMVSNNVRFGLGDN